MVSNRETYKVAAGEALLDLRGLGALACRTSGLAKTAWGYGIWRCRSAVTSSGRANEDHADLISSDGACGTSSTVLELLDTGIEAADDRLQLLELIFNETHLDG